MLDTVAAGATAAGVMVGVSMVAGGGVVVETRLVAAEVGCDSTTLSTPAKALDPTAATAVITRARCRPDSRSAIRLRCALLIAVESFPRERWVSSLGGKTWDFLRAFPRAFPRACPLYSGWRIREIQGQAREATRCGRGSRYGLVTAASGHDPPDRASEEPPPDAAGAWAGACSWPWSCPESSD